ncbi:MAG: hypothetical protein WCW36_00425 [Candidatus Paceibacterota bacterium]|jgi:hypothetical protein
MPQRRSSQKPPEAMTWSKSLPVIIVAGIFDLVRMFFEMFWFFGPALAAIYCTDKVSGILTKVTLGALGTKTAGLVCSSAAIAGGAAASETLVAFGVIMAIAVGFAGFLILGLWMLMTNARIFKTVESAPLQFVASFGVSEIPLIGTIPTFSIVLWKLYKSQIQVEQEALQKWQKEHAQEIAGQRRERQQQAAYLMQARTAELAQDDIY